MCTGVEPERPTTDWPPSPPAALIQPVRFENDHVPLSCVPPSSSSGMPGGLTETLWNSSVGRPLLRLKFLTGTARSSCLQMRFSGGVRPRVAHACVRSANVPLVRTIPPSDPRNATPELFGENAIACWSGCMMYGGDSVSALMSFQVEPPSVERMTVRPLLQSRWCHF